MNYRQIFLFLSLMLMDIAPALAVTPAPEESFTRINQCIKDNDDVGCRELFTTSSLELYDRFVSYPISKCLPRNATFIMQQKIADNQVIIYASVTINNTFRVMSLVFVKEEGEWKLDAPESLHVALGDNWEQKVDKAEQIFLLLWQQIGPQFNCNSIQDLVNKYRHKK